MNEVYTSSSGYNDKRNLNKHLEGFRFHLKNPGKLRRTEPLPELPGTLAAGTQLERVHCPSLRTELSRLLQPLPTASHPP